MINVIFDTNILVGSLLSSSGANRKCLLVAFGNPDLFNVCYSSQIMSEYEDVLSRNIITSAGLSSNAAELLDIIHTYGEEVVPKFLPAVVYPDYKDKPFLEASVYVDGILITNNLKDFPFAGVNVCAPQHFINWWNAQGGTC